MTEPPAHPRVVIVGLGNELRGDDGAGLLVARRLQAGAPQRDVVVRECSGEVTGLLDALEGADAAVVVDAARGAGPAGGVWRLDATREPLPRHRLGPVSSHDDGLAEAIELARALGRLPARVIVYAVVGTRFEVGAPLSAPVDQVLDALGAAVMDEALRLAADPQICSGRISMAPHGHSRAHSPQPLQ